MDSILNAISKLEIPTDSKVWIGFSGGLDSTVLLHASLRGLGASRCHALHVNHQLSPSSEGWADHCAEISRLWGVPFNSDTVEVSEGNLEHQARLSRYSIFRQRLSPGDYLFTAHHRDDDTETLLWQLLTGRALIGIPIRRSLGAGKLCRPLLNIERREIERYAQQHELVWVEDESNLDTNFNRNWIRHELIPQLESRFPQAKDQILELKQATLPAAELGPLKLSESEMSIEKIRAWLIAYEINPPSTVLREIFLQANARQDANPEIKVAENYFVRRYRSQLYCVPSYETFEPMNVTVGQSIRVCNGVLKWERSNEGFEKGHTLLCTNRRHLSREKRIIKLDAMHKRFGNLFQESAIPPWLRDGWPVLCDGDSVVSLVGVATDTSAIVWQNERTFAPSWHPYE